MFEHESKLAGVTKRIFVTPWEYRKRMNVGSEQVLRLLIPRPPKQYRISLGAIHCYGTSSAAGSSRIIELTISDGSGLSDTSNPSTNEQLIVLSGDTNLYAFQLNRTFYPDGLLFERGQSLHFMMQSIPIVGVDTLTIQRMLVHFRYENWS